MPKIDAIVCFHPKDMLTLEPVIQGLKDNIEDLGTIYVISDKKYTEKAEWIDEKMYPFTKDEIADLCPIRQMAGWYFQQLLKFYAPLVINGLSRWFLHSDADVLWLNRTGFFNSGTPLYDYDTNLPHHPYLYHMDKLCNIKKAFPDKNSMVHHLLWDSEVVRMIFKDAMDKDGDPFYVAFMKSVPGDHPNSASEMEIYFNYIFTHGINAELRKLKWELTWDHNSIQDHAKEGFNFIVLPEYLRNAESVYVIKDKK
jgi:hypothetical protein